MRTISAVLHSAINLYYTAPQKWHVNTEVAELINAISEMTGIGSGIIEIAVSEKVANKLTKDLHDICSQRLRQNLTGQRHYGEKVRTNRFGGASTTTEPIEIAHPISDLVDQWIGTLENGAFTNNGLTPSSPFEAKRDEFLRRMAKALPTIGINYSEEFVESLESICESVTGGVA